MGPATTASAWRIQKRASRMSSFAQGAVEEVEVEEGRTAPMARARRTPARLGPAVGAGASLCGGGGVGAWGRVVTAELIA